MAVKRALITGVTGMVGSHLVDYLLANTDWDVYGMCRWRSPQDNVDHLLQKANKKERLYFLYGDLRDGVSLMDVIGKSKPDYIFHLAAQSYPQVSFASPLDTLETNVTGTASLLEAVRHFRAKGEMDPVIHVCASSEVFGRVPKENLPIGEESNFHPASPYAISKVGTDLLGRYYGEAYGMKTVTTRMFTQDRKSVV
jgi:GDPmannose 4,6-dehydratase